MKDIEEKIFELQKEIASLPIGNVVKKVVNNNTYFYHRFYTNGKRKEVYLNNDLVNQFKSDIEQRKKLEKKLKELKASLPKETFLVKSPMFEYDTYHTNILKDNELRKFVEKVKNYKKRDCYSNINDYLKDKNSQKVLILYGLRRTGKTTLIRQVILNMKESDFKKTAFIQIKASDSLSDINMDLRKLESLGYKYVFIDEVTSMKDFVDGAALFSDIYVASGMKIVLSGTDSLGFLFAIDEQLYDRSLMIHTTFIPYHEFESVLGIKGIDEYIKYGGTMCLSGTNYNEESIFSNSKNTNEYIDNAIAKNIQHSLSHYKDSTHFRSLKELYEKDELTNAINRVVEDINHRFVINTLEKTFESSDLAISKKNLRNDLKRGNDILDRINSETITKRLKKALEILNKKEQTINIKEDHIREIKEYLELLDLIVDIDVNDFSYNKEFLTVITQPGIRYIQALELIDSILLDKTFEKLNIKERNEVIERIKNEVKGRMMEEIILLETKLSLKDKEVFKLKFAIGEFDMVIYDKENMTCDIYEIKHSKEVVPNQYKNLIDKNKLSKTEFRYGSIKNKCVIYRGDTLIKNDIKYINVEEYLNNLNYK